MNDSVEQQIPTGLGDVEIQASSMDVAHGIEKFTASDLATLRSDLLQSGVDSFKAAELVTSFLSGRGYGI
jgi:hypothetical protein